MSSKEILTELIRREKEAKIVPDPVVDAYLKVFFSDSLNFLVEHLASAPGLIEPTLICSDNSCLFIQAIAVEGQSTTLQTDYILKVLSFKI